MATASKKRSATRKTSKKHGPKRKTKAAAGKAPNPAFAFLMAFMKKHPKAAYADAAAAAEKAGHKIYPISWGRAQLLLGRVKPKKKATARKARASKIANGRRKRLGRPRGSKNAPRSSSSGSISISDAEVASAGALVEALNAGGKAVLRYDGSGWVLAVE